MLKQANEVILQTLKTIEEKKQNKYKKCNNYVFFYCCNFEF